VLLAAWLKEHGHIVSTLKIYDAGATESGWVSAWGKMAAVFQAASASAAAAAAAEAAAAIPLTADAAESSSKLWQLQAFSARVPGAAAASVQPLRHLPAHKPTQLEWYLDVADPGQMNASPLNDFSRFTALCSVDVTTAGWGLSRQSDSVLVPLSALLQLTSL
jgi:hypothetical protein